MKIRKRPSARSSGKCVGVALIEGLELAVGQAQGEVALPGYMPIDRRDGCKLRVRQGLTREEARQSFRDEAAKAWREYGENGRHATQAEVDAWIDSLGTRAGL